MFNCKDFNSKVVLSLYEGELLGKVDKLFFDRKLKKLCVLELVNDEGVKFDLIVKNIYHVGKNAITVKNNQAVNIQQEKQEFCCSPIGSKAFSINGEFLGVVEEITFDEKFVTNKVFFDNGNSVEVKMLASCSRNTVVFYNENNKIKINSLSPEKQPKEFKNNDVEVETLPIQSEPPKTIETKPSMKNVEFLIGRVCTKDIYNFNNELLIKAHSIVNKKNLKEVNKFGKLRELMLFSR